MYPAASVSGWYFSHPDSKYFGVGKIGQDQVKAISDSRGEPIELTKKFLRPNIDGYFKKKLRKKLRRKKETF